MKLKTFTRRAAAAGAVLAALMLAALPALAAPKVQVNTTNAVADHADILSDETEQYVNDVSIKLSDACGAQIGVYTLDELLGSTTMEGFAYDVFNAWGLGSDDLDNGVLLLLAPNEADGGDYYIMRGDGLESQLSFSTLGSLLDEYMEPYWVNGDYDTGTQKTVQALANRLCSIYGVTLDSGYAANTTARGGVDVMGMILLIFAVILAVLTFMIVSGHRKLRYLFFAAAGLVPLYVILTIARSHDVTYLNGIFEMKNAATPIFITQPYMYIANNYDNFDCLVRELPAHSMGLKGMFPLWALSGLKFIKPTLVDWPIYVNKEELTTVTLFYDAYYDFGIAGVFLFSSVLGAAAAWLSARTYPGRNPAWYLFYSQGALYFMLSFFTTWYSNPTTWFYFVVTGAFGIFLEIKHNRRRRQL